MTVVLDEGAGNLKPYVAGRACQTRYKRQTENR